MDLAALIAELRILEPQYRDLQTARTRLTNQGKASCRRHAGGDKLIAARLYKEIEKGVPSPEGLWHVVVIANQAKQITEEINWRRARMEMLARSLPAFEWVESAPGLGALGLARIVGEAGDLSNYSNPAKLWSRFGLGRKEYGGEFLTQRRYADKNKAIAVKFSSRRRSLIYAIWVPTLKVQKDSQYKSAYYEKKKEYQDRGWTKMHAHNAAGRFASKRILRDLWNA